MSDIPPGRIEMEKVDQYVSAKVDGEEIGQKDEPQEPTAETASILLLPNVLKTIKTLGSCSDLFALRQVNEDYHEFLGSTCCVFFDPILDFGFGRHDAVENFNPKIAHIYRSLLFYADYLGQRPLVRNVEAVIGRFNEIISHVTPYITTITFYLNQWTEVTTGAEYSEFFNQFINLENLKIQCGRPFFYSYCTPKIPEPTDELAVGLSNLNIKPKIHFTLTELDHREMILDKFALKENTTFEIEIGKDENHGSTFCFKFEEFQNICTKYGHLQNIRYTINEWQLPFDKFKIFTSLCVQIGSQIDKIYLALGIKRASWFQEGVNQGDIWNCLNQLSPFVTQLKLCQPKDSSMEYPWDVVLNDTKWPKLKKLVILKYKSPLNILKNCTNLKYLRLEIDQNKCIFSNTQQSDKESLDEYFGHLDQLTKLVFKYTKKEDKIYKGSELDKYLKATLPKLKRISHIKIKCKTPVEDTESSEFEP